MELTDLEKKIMAYCIEDDMGLWVVVTYVYGGAYPIDINLPAWVREKTLEVLNNLISQGLIKIGQMVRKENKIVFEPYSSSDLEIIQGVEQEWINLGRPPDIADICWIRASDAGVKLANGLGLET